MNEQRSQMPLIVAMFIAGCGGEVYDYPKGLPDVETICQRGTSCCSKQEIICRGDPDSELVCSCDRSWSCNDPYWPSRCNQGSASAPDGTGGWDCTITGEFEQCVKTGSTPPAGGGWTCTVSGTKVVCRRKANTPDGTSNWTCTYSGEFKTCEKTGGGVIGGGFAGKNSISGGGGTCGKDVQDMLIVLDRSGSMGSQYGGLTKWEHATTAVKGLAATFAGKIRFGLMVFPKGSTCAAGAVDVPIGASSGAAITAALSTLKPSGGTPIASSLSAAGAYLSGTGTSSSRVVLLVTDGAESCGGAPDAQVKALAAAQVKTFVVGFGSGVDASQLNSMAVSGGTALSGSKKYYSTDDPNQLDATLKAIGSTVCK